MILICFLLLTAGSSQEVSPHDSWEHAMTLARDVSLKSLTVVLADDQVKSANWRSLLGEAQPITFFTDTSLVPEEQSSRGLVLSSKIFSLSKALDGLRKRNLTGYGVHWQLVVSSPASKRIFLAGFDGEQLALQLPLPSSLHNTCTTPREKETQATLYSLRSLGNGSTCWAPVVDGTSQLFEAYPSSLSDRTLRVISLGLYPVRKKPEAEDDWRWSGFVFDVLNCLADSLHFRYESRDPEHHYYFAQLPSGAYVGVIGDVARKVADVALGDLSRTMTRDALVDFTSFILDDAVTFVYYRGKTEPGLWTVLKPFPASVWALTLSAMVLMITLLFTCNVARETLRTLDGTSTCSRRVFDVIKCVMRSYITQDKVIEEGPRPLLGCWYVVLLVLTTVYCGRLTAFYVATLEEPVTSLAQLVARRPNAVILVKNGSLPYEVLRQKTFESLWRQRVVHVVSARTPVDDLLRMVAQHRAAGWMAEAAFGGARIREARMNGLSVASTSMAVSRWCIGLRQGSPLVPLFNKKILQLWSHGLIEHLRKKYFHADPVLPPDPSQVLTLGNCKALFWMWFLGLMVASAACVLERTLAGRYSRQKRLPNITPRLRRRVDLKPDRCYSHAIPTRYRYQPSVKSVQIKIVRRATGLPYRKQKMLFN